MQKVSVKLCMYSIGAPSTEFAARGGTCSAIGEFSLQHMRLHTRH